MKDSEILSDLISLAFDSNPKDTSISLRDCIDLLTRTIITENESDGFAGIVAKQHALFADRVPVPEPRAEVTPGVSAGAGTQSGSNAGGKCRCRNPERK